MLVLIGLAGRPLPPRGASLASVPLVEIMLAIAVLAVASMIAGLLISAVVNSSDKTMPLLVLVVLMEVVLSGAVFRLNGKAVLEQIAWLAPSRWGLGATAATVDLNQVTPPPPGSTLTRCGSTVRISGFSTWRCSWSSRPRSPRSPGGACSS